VYLRAAEAFARVQAANVAASVAVMEKGAARIAAGCPSILVGAPQGGQLSELEGELAAAVLFSAAGPNRRAMLSFASKVDALHWSNRRIARLVRSLAAEERATAKLTLPNVCADIRVWTASGYHTLSASTLRFIKATEAIGKQTGGGGHKGESLEEAVLGRLRPYETPSDRRLAIHVGRLNETVGNRLLPAYFMTLGRVGQALGLTSS
jgi:hypothetical protein